MIVTLCGSARFEGWFHLWNRVLSLAGHSVFGLSSYPSQNSGIKDWYTPEDKTVLDDVHKNKIAASDAILVLNVFAYIGESTLSEIEHAHKISRREPHVTRPRIYMLQSWGKGCGVGNNHSELYRGAAEGLGVAGARSPIEATVGPYLFPMNMFGPGGPKRSRLVEMVRNEEERLYNEAFARNSRILDRLTGRTAETT